MSRAFPKTWQLFMEDEVVFMLFCGIALLFQKVIPGYIISHSTVGMIQQD
jgi:hypothetical protein